MGEMHGEGEKIKVNGILKGEGDICKDNVPLFGVGEKIDKPGEGENSNAGACNSLDVGC
jgi:hypothetical protein